MEEYMKNFKVDLEKLFDDLYVDLDALVDSTMFNMSFIEDDPEGNYAKLQDIMIETLSERIVRLYSEEDES